MPTSKDKTLEIPSLTLEEIIKKEREINRRISLEYCEIPIFNVEVPFQKVSLTELEEIKEVSCVDNEDLNRRLDEFEKKIKRIINYSKIKK